MTVPTTAQMSPSRHAGRGAASEADRKKRRRGKRGGKRNRPQEAGDREAVAGDAGAEIDGAGGGLCRRTRDRRSRGGCRDRNGNAAVAEPEAAAKAKPQRAPRRTKKVIAAELAAEAEAAALAASRCRCRAGFRCRERRHAGSRRACNRASGGAGTTAGSVEELRPLAPQAGQAMMLTPVQPVVVSTSGSVDESKPKKAGWWQRKGFF